VYCNAVHLPPPGPDSLGNPIAVSARWFTGKALEVSYATVLLRMLACWRTAVGRASFLVCAR
jgi:hypothetical protein